MNFVNFAFWLQGYFELSEAKQLSAKQVAIIKSHLELACKTEALPETSEVPSHSPGVWNPDTLIRC